MQGIRYRSLFVVLVVAVFILLGLGSVVTWTGMRSQVDILNRQSVPALLAVSDINANFKDLHTLLLSMAMERDPRQRDRLQQQLDRHLKQLTGAVSGLRGLGMESPALEEVSSAFLHAVNAAAEVAHEGRRDDAVAQIYATVMPAEKNMTAYVEGVRGNLLTQQQALDEKLSYGGMTLLAYCAAGILLGLLLRGALLPSIGMLVKSPRDALVTRDIARMLHGYTGSVLVASLVAAAAQVAVFLDHPYRLLLFCWGATVLGVLATRLAAYLRWLRPAGKDSGDSVAIRNFGAGCVASALVWALFPVLFFAGASPVQRMVTAFLYAAMAGAGSAVLASMWRVLQVYLGLLLLPLAACFAYGGTRLDVTMAVLSVGMFMLLLHSAANARQSTLSALMLSSENQRLAEESVTRQLELENLNTRLEDRVHERTIMLELEVEAREKYAAQLKLLAQRDPLTGLLNRRALAEQMEELLARAAGVGMGMQVLFIDLDRFKEVNDVQGHYVGDQVLIEVANRLRRALPEPAVVARWGGDEFVAVVPVVAGRNLVPLVRDCLVEPVQVRGQEVRVDVSIGISQSPEQGRDVELLVRQADVALHHAKLRGRSCSSIYDAAMGDQLRRLHDLGQALREALERDALSIVFQPIVPQKPGYVNKMEALVRWHDPMRGTIAPGEFIALAEEVGLIGKLGSWVLLRACEEACCWACGAMVSVNVSALQVMAGGLVEEVQDVLARTGLPACQLELELTESVFVRDLESAIEVLGALRRMGVRIAIDDFGTGYSSLSYLNRLPVDTIKIDRSFVVSSAHEGNLLLRAILGMARGLRCHVVAEGAENEAQVRMLQDLGVDYIQGNQLCEPVRAELARAWLERFAA